MLDVLAGRTARGDPGRELEVHGAELVVVAQGFKRGKEKMPQLFLQFGGEKRAPNATGAARLPGIATAGV